MKIQELNLEGWEKIIHASDPVSGLEAIISVHDSTLGPGCGGCRIRPYETFDLALEDVKRLSRGMTFKNALGGIPFGGGKAVIIADPTKDKSEALFRAYGRAIEALEGKYYTAEDSGVTEDDLEIVRKETAYVAGIASKGIGGNPSPFTARGVWRGMQAAAAHKFGSSDLKGRSVSILGVGAVGMALAELLHREGASLVVADVNEKALEHARSAFDAEVVAPDEAIAADVDIFSPCALGGSINSKSIDRLKAKIVAGAANNQFLTPDMDEALKAKGILYAPDYVINAAGVISVGLEILGEWTPEELSRRIDGIGDTLSEIFRRAEDEDRPTGAIADALALEVIARGRKAA